MSSIEFLSTGNKTGVKSWGSGHKFRLISAIYTYNQDVIVVRSEC